MNRDDAILNPLIIGSLLNLFSVLLFPVIFLIGYGMEVFRNVAKGDPEPPTFGHWGRLFGDGLKGTVLVLIYFGVPSVILFLLLVISTPDQSTTVATEPGTGAVFGAFVISLPLFLVGGYFFPAAFGGVARSGRLGSGFDFAGILDATLSGKYFVGWLRAFVVYMVFLMVIAFLFAMNIIPILGTVIFLFGVFIFQFYLLVSITYVFARAYAESLRLVSKYPRQAEQGPMPSASDRGGTK